MWWDYVYKLTLNSPWLALAVLPFFAIDRWFRFAAQRMAHREAPNSEVDIRLGRTHIIPLAEQVKTDDNEVETSDNQSEIHDGRVDRRANGHPSSNGRVPGILLARLRRWIGKTDKSSDS